MNRIEDASVEGRRKGQYEDINGCTHSTPCWQVVAISLVLAIEILNFYLIPEMVDLGLNIVYVLYGANFVALLFVIIDFFILTFSDPSDPRLKDASYAEEG